jgi:hypothetical protein
MFPGDLSDAEWALVAPLIPPGRRGERQRSTNAKFSTQSSIGARDWLPTAGIAEKSDPEEHGAFSRTQAVKDRK